MDITDVRSIKETTNEEKWRMISILSYVIVLLGFGLPIWWATTRVYRAPLPLDEMLELQPEPLPPIQVFLKAATEEKTKMLIVDLKNILGNSFNLSPYTSNSPITEGTLLLQEQTNAPYEVSLTSGRVLHYRPGISATHLARVLLAWPGARHSTALAADSVATHNDDTKSVPAASEYDVVITVVQNDGNKLEWDLVGAIDEYLKPYLSSLSPLANFTVKSSVLRYAALGVRARRVGPQGALAEALLAHAAAPLETRLAGHMARRPPLHIVLYVPDCDEAPLYIYTKSGNRAEGAIPAFISPRWGGVQILNPDCDKASWAPNMKIVMGAAVTQLSRLLGVPAVPVGAHQPSSQHAIPADWQLDWMIRSRTKEYLDSARMTLRSLAQLLSEISNIVISDEVAESVWGAVMATNRAQHQLETGDTRGALVSAQDAAQAAEAAFTDPSLIALLYFPDDQKYAVYIPLFLPIMIPVLMSMKQLIQYIKKPKVS